MLKRRFAALVLVGLFALVVIGSISGRPSVNAVSYSPIEPVKGFTLAASTEEYIAEAFTDVTTRWTNEGNAYDGDWGTATAYTAGKFCLADASPSAYASGFDTAASGSGAITQVDIIVRHVIAGLDTSDKWAITLDVGASTDNDLQALTTANYPINNQTFTDVTEPNGGGWTWAEVQAAQIHFDEDKVGGGDKADWSIYELSFKITSEDAGIPYEKDMTETVSAVDVQTNAADYDRSYTESVSAADVQTNVADFVRNLVESIGVVGVLTMLRGREKDLVETISASDVLTNSGSFVRSYTESVSVVDVISKAVGINMTEAVSVADIGTFAKAIQKSMVEAITVSDVQTNAVNYARDLTESISAIDALSNAAVYVRDFVEAITAADTIEASKAIQKSMFEAITVSDVQTNAVDYARNLTEIISAVDVRTFSADFVRDLVEAITVVEIIDAQKLGGIDYEKDLTEVIGVSTDLTTDPPAPSVVIGSMFYQLFFSLDMWGYIGPLALVIIGYLVASKDKNLGVLWFVLESLMIANYLTLVSVTKDYWWHIFILLIGCMSTLMYSVRDRW